MKQTLGTAYLVKGSIHSKTALCLNEPLDLLQKIILSCNSFKNESSPSLFLKFLRDNKWIGMLRKLLGGI